MKNEKAQEADASRALVAFVAAVAVDIAIVVLTALVIVEPEVVIVVIVVVADVDVDGDVGGKMNLSQQKYSHHMFARSSRVESQSAG